jgi:hypothetical protein
MSQYYICTQNVVFNKSDEYLLSSPTHDIPGADGTFGNTENKGNKIIDVIKISFIIFI